MVVVVVNRRGEPLASTKRRGLIQRCRLRAEHHLWGNSLPGSRVHGAHYLISFHLLQLRGYIEEQERAGIAHPDIRRVCCALWGYFRFAFLVKRSAIIWLHQHYQEVT